MLERLRKIGLIAGGLAVVMVLGALAATFVINGDDPTRDDAASGGSTVSACGPVEVDVVPALGDPAGTTVTSLALDHDTCEGFSATAALFDESDGLIGTCAVDALGDPSDDQSDVLTCADPAPSLAALARYELVIDRGDARVSADPGSGQGDGGMPGGGLGGDGGLPGGSGAPANDDIVDAQVLPSDPPIGVMGTTRGATWDGPVDVLPDLFADVPPATRSQFDDSVWYWWHPPAVDAGIDLFEIETVRASVGPRCEDPIIAIWGMHGAAPGGSGLGLVALGDGAGYSRHPVAVPHIPTPPFGSPPGAVFLIGVACETPGQTGTFGLRISALSPP